MLKKETFHSLEKLKKFSSAHYTDLQKDGKDLELLRKKTQDVYQLFLNSEKKGK